MESSRGLTDATTKPFRGPWEGDDKIVIGVDIGTTQSGVAFAFLQSGASQTIHRVTRWPGQEAQNQQGKIPTLVWYDSNKKAVSFGAEALSPLAEEQAEDHHWTLARNFKLHLHPDDMKEKHGLKLEKLPPGVSLDQIYTDFLGYLLEHTRSYFEDRILDGRRIWEQYKSSMDLIIAHPNGWAIREQSFLRAAVVNTGFVDIAGAATKVRFVSEAEASVHFCIYHTNIGSRLQAGSNFAVCDAGGSTVDTTLYSVGSARPTLELKEQRGSACVQAGAIFVDMAAEAYLRKTLVTAGLGESETEEFSKVGVKDFEAFAKRTFGDDIKEYSIAIAHSRFNNPSIKTRRGRMSVPGFAIKSFFETCTTEIIASVDQQVRGLNVSHILLVGGFGGSPFLRDGFKKRYEPQGCQVTLTNDSTSKAVADGAVIWGTISSVVSRAPRSSFGVITLTRYSPHVPEQQGRTLTLLADGYQWVDGGWSPVVSKDIPLDVQAVSRQTFSRFYSGPNPQLSVFEVRLLSYGGEGQPPWALNAQGGLVTGFRYVCVIKANLSNLSGALKRRAGHSRKAYWHLTFDVCIRFGGTELEVYLEWEEHGATRTGPVTVVPENTV